MDFFWTYIWPLTVIAAQSVLLLVILLIAIAYILLADRKIWAAVRRYRRCCRMVAVTAAATARWQLWSVI